MNFFESSRLRDRQYLFLRFLDDDDEETLYGDVPMAKQPEGWIESDIEFVRRKIHELVPGHVTVDFEEETRSTINRNQVYLMLIGPVGVFKSRNDRMGIVTYAVSYPSNSETEEEFGTLKGALDRVAEIINEVNQGDTNVTRTES